MRIYARLNSFVELFVDTNSSNHGRLGLIQKNKKAPHLNEALRSKLYEKFLIGIIIL